MSNQRNHFSGYSAIALLAFVTNAFAGPFQDGQAYGNAAVGQGGTLGTAFGNANGGVNWLNSGIGIVQPNGQTVLNMQQNGVTGNANGTGLGSFGTSNMNRCAGYVPGSGGPTQDAECGAVNFSSQQVNINAQARTAYGLTANSSMFTHANSAVSGAAANQSTLLPGTSTTATTGGQTCTTIPGAVQNTTQSCYVYAQQATGGGAVSTWATGTAINVTCTGGASITATSCTVTPAQATRTESCLTQTNQPPTGTSTAYQVGSQANVTCDSGSIVTSNNCTVNPAQATHNAACYATTNTPPGGAEGFYPANTAANVNCIVGANLGATSCTVNPPQASHNATCQVSVPTVKTCNIINSATVTLNTVNWCQSGPYPIYDGGCSWDGILPGWQSHPQIGWAMVTCTGQYTFNITINITAVGPYSISPNVFSISYGAPVSGMTDIMSNQFGSLQAIYGSPISWDGSSSVYFGVSNGYAAWCGSSSIPIGSNTVASFAPATSDGCAPYGG